MFVIRLLKQFSANSNNKYRTPFTSTLARLNYIVENMCSNVNDRLRAKRKCLTVFYCAIVELHIVAKRLQLFAFGRFRREIASLLE